MKMVSGFLLVATALYSSGCGPSAVSDLPSEEEKVAVRPAIVTSLPETLNEIAAEAAWRSPGTGLSISVRNLATGERGEIAGGVKHVSASSAKAVWVAAALHGAGLGSVAPYSEPIFRTSDNYASGSVIDLIGPNAVNDFQWNVAGMPDSALTSWSFGASRIATNSPRAMGSDNYFTANDVTEFLARLDREQLLAPDATTALRQWMTLSPRSGYGGWLGSRLPAAAGASMMHKAGWLPPGCCGDDATYNTLNDVGIVQTPTGERYAIAILARRGNDYWGKQAALVEWASCRVYQSVAMDEALQCARVTDPFPPAASCGNVTYAGTCSNEVLTWCQDGGLRTKDCASTGKVCGWQSEEVGNNCLASAPPPPPPCGDLTYLGTCDGNVISWCDDGQPKTVDCAATNRVCGWQSEEVGYNCLAP